MVVLYSNSLAVQIYSIEISNAFIKVRRHALYDFGMFPGKNFWFFLFGNVFNESFYSLLVTVVAFNVIEMCVLVTSWFILWKESKFYILHILFYFLYALRILSVNIRWLYIHASQAVVFGLNKFKYANCWNTGTLAGDLPETNFVLFAD